MKALAVLCLCIFLQQTIAAPESEEEKAVHALCAAESGVDEELLIRAEAGDWVPDKSLQCYFKCMLTVIGVLSPEGVIDEEKFVDLWYRPMKEEAAHSIRTCKTQKGADLCETAYLTEHCYQIHGPNAFYII